MYNGESYRTTPNEEPSPSNLRTQGMNAAQNVSDPSPSGLGPSSGVQLASDGIHDFGFSQLQGLQHYLAPLIQVNGAFQNSPLQGNPGSVYCGGPLASYEPNLNTGNATATASSCQGGSNVPTNMPYGGLPMALPNLPSGQASNPGANFQVAGQPPTMTWLHNLHLPEVLARPNEQGNPGPSWQLADADLEYEGGDDLRVIIHFRRTPPS